MKPVAIDAFDFGRMKEQRKGELAVAELPRLARECVESSGTLRWTLTGGTHDSGHRQLMLQVDGAVQLLCQRCLKPFSYLIASQSVLVLVQDEAQADQVEAMLDDDSIDVIVGAKAMDVIELIEDEALLAIPQAPKHAQCVEQIPEQEGIVVKPSPFAVLKNIRH